MIKYSHTFLIIFMLKKGQFVTICIRLKLMCGLIFWLICICLLIAR